MKKLLLVGLCAVLGLGTVKAQAPVVVSGEITTNTTWTNNNIYLLNGFVYVEDGAELTIQAGTLIKGDKDSKGTLIVTKTGKIHATGTACQPIVFTSNQPTGSRAPGDWGGVIILGNANINPPGGDAIIEGGVDTPEGDGHYGGVNDADNSGEFQYCRIEFPGIAFLPNNEINGLTCGGVGSGTHIDHVMVAYSGDDSFEWFGGSVNAKYLIAYRGLDDDFDTDFGYHGKVQFGVALRDPSVADVSGSNGFESDNDATGSANTPYTKARLSNMTICGPLVTPATVINVNFKRGAHLRRDTKEGIYNSIIMGFPEAGLKIEGVNTSQNAIADELQFKNNILSGNTTDLLATTVDPLFNITTFFNSNNNNAFTNNSSVGLVDPFNLSAPDFTPTGVSVANFLGTYFSGDLTDPFFTSTTYRGAFATGDDWTKCWANWDCQNTPYATAGINYSPSLSGVVTNASCPGSGAIDLSVSGGVAPFSYSWSNGATTQDISGLAAGTYTVTVTGCNCSATQSFTVTTTPLAKPAGLSVSAATQCSAKLSWASVAGAQSYEVRFRLSPAGVYSSPVNVGLALNYTFTGLTASTAYEFNVRSKCTSGATSAWSKKSGMTVACGAPTASTVTGITATSATVSWTDPCSVGSYRLRYRKVGVAAWTNVNVSGAPTKTLTGLLANTAYEYQIRTNCAGGSSAYSALTSFTTLVMRVESGVVVDENMLNMYPNPAQNTVTVNIETGKETSVNMMITDVLGKVVYTQNNIAVNGIYDMNLDVTNFQSGIYVVTVEGENIKVSKQLVINK